MPLQKVFVGTTVLRDEICRWNGLCNSIFNSSLSLHCLLFCYNQNTPTFTTDSHLPTKRTCSSSLQQMLLISAHLILEKCLPIGFLLHDLRTV
ncbi:hypothetical protein SUGI_1315080 [Cryptomeria japonica]|uniref:Uncharacterized protein n=1 Tax=Cryptomeria japonica TaxID=3369 RepID=A0AAD3RPK2_CRYJA|nr:hypothetical protein SUGI_1315080 [Cryptomeria japonica]